MRLIIITFFLTIQTFAQNNLPPLGQWREHLPYQNAIDVTATDKKIFAATPHSLFSVDKATKEVTRLSKISGLSETGISAIEYDPLSNNLYVAYTNSNIDVLTENAIVNIPQLKRSNISGDKKIYDIYTDNSLAYLSTGLGILVVDALKYEIKDSWFIGNNGGYIKTYSFLKSNNFFYAATEEGLKKAATNSPNISDYRAWTTITKANGLSPSTTKAILQVENKIIALQNDSLFVENGSSWSHFFSNTWPILSIKQTENKLIVSQRMSNGAAQVLVLSTSGIIERVIQQPGFISYPLTGISAGGDYWIADLFGGLSHWTQSSFESYRLNSPQNISTGGMTVLNNVIYVTAGSVNKSWNYQYNPNGIFQLENGEWTNINLYTRPVLDSVLDFLTVAADPRDGSAWAGSFGGGLVHIKGTDIKIFKQNSPIQPTVGDPGSYRVAGLAFDNQNNLWVSNFGSQQQLHVLKNNGAWQSFTIPFSLNENAVAQILIDDAGQKWIVSPLGNGLIVFNEGALENPSDDKWKIYKYGASNGNLPSSDVLSIAKDKNGFIWVGTTDGVGVIQCPQDAFTTTGCEAILPIIKEGSFANFLFKGQAVTSIAIDGVNRKWIATPSGAWLVSADGDKIISHFREENSPLLSNDVRNITINGSTGEVYFATANGLVSFRGNATEAEETKNNVMVFPNPVMPGYSGSIGIKGLPENSFVKIIEMNGRLVHQSRSFGGQATWNGKDYNGNKVSTGVYLVIAVDELKQEKVVTKIVFIGK